MSKLNAHEILAWVEFESPRVFVEEYFCSALYSFVRYNDTFIYLLHCNRTRNEVSFSHVALITQLTIDVLEHSSSSLQLRGEVLFDRVALISAPRLKRDGVGHQISLYEAEKVIRDEKRFQIDHLISLIDRFYRNEQRLCLNVIFRLQHHRLKLFECAKLILQVFYNDF